MGSEVENLRKNINSLTANMPRVHDPNIEVFEKKFNSILIEQYKIK